MTFPNMKEMARFATEDYSKIESLDQIKPPYPAQGTANWWALRQRYEQILLAKIRRERKGADVANHHECNCAKWATIGNEAADARYKQYVPTAAEVTARVKPDWLSITASMARDR